MTLPVTRREPLPAFCFGVFIKDRGIEGPTAFFKSISGLKGETEVLDYREGGLNETVHRRMGPTKWSNLTFKQGFCGPPYTLLDWRMRVVAGEPARANGRIVQYNSKMQPICEWAFYRAWPCRWEGPDYDASKSELGIETIELAHEGLEFRYLATNTDGSRYIASSGVGKRKIEHASYRIDRDDKNRDANGNVIETLVVVDTHVEDEIDDDCESSFQASPAPARPVPPASAADPAAILE